MELKVETVALQDAIRVITRLANPITGNVNVQSDGKKLFLHAANEASRCMINLPATVTGKPRAFAVPVAALREATKGRKDLNIVYDKAMCKITSGNFKIDLATVDATEAESEEEAKIGKPIVLTHEQVLWLKSAVSTVALKPMALLESAMPVAIKLTSKGAFVACYDENRMSYINSAEINGDVEVKLPIETIAAVLDTFSAGGLKIEMSNATLFVSNKLTKVQLALPQAGEQDLAIEDILATAKNARKADGSEIAVAKSDLVAFLENARAVATKERSEISLEAKDNKLRLSVTTVNGNAKTVIKAKAGKASSAKVDLEFIDEAVRKCGDEVTFKIVKDEFINVNLKNASVLVSVNQEDGGDAN